MIWLFIALLVIAALFFLWLFAISPSSDCKEKFAPFKGVEFAHRGLHGDDVPENSPEAFRRAVDAGYGIELDVHITADGKLVVFHDNDTSRMCGEKLLIEKSRYDELSPLRLAGTDEHIPLFSEVLDIVDGKVPLLVEIKTVSTETAPCLPVSETMKEYHGQWCMESFNPFAVRWFSRNRPDICRGQLSSKIPVIGHGLGGRISGFLLSNLLTNFLARPDFIAYALNYRNNPSLTLCRKLLSAPVAVWTPRGDRERKLASDLGWYSAFIFEKNPLRQK